MTDATASGGAATARRRIFGWKMFDWATQPFYTLGLTFIFGPYFASVLAETFMGTGLDEATSDARAQSIWSGGQTVAGLLIAFTAPIVGAYADSTGQRMRWIWGASVLFVLGAWALWYMTPDGQAWLFCLVAFCVAFVAGEYALIFTNSILPSLGDDDEVGKISGDGAALGYWGGVLSLVVMLVFFFELEAGRTLLGTPPALGLDGTEREGTRIVGPLIAVWFVVFMIPFFLFVREGNFETWGTKETPHYSPHPS
ncbi:MAG: MFS transporter [Shimia sp.]